MFTVPVVEHAREAALSTDGAGGFKDVMSSGFLSISFLFLSPLSFFLFVFPFFLPRFSLWLV